MRLEQPAALAQYVLADQPEWTPEQIDAAMHGGQERTVKLKAPIPVYLGYFTARVSADGLLIRTVDADDRRVGRLRLTEPAQHIADESRAARRAALSAVLDELEPGQLVRPERGLDVLAEMTRMLHERQP